MQNPININSNFKNKEACEKKKQNGIRQLMNPICWFYYNL